MRKSVRLSVMAGAVVAALATAAVPAGADTAATQPSASAGTVAPQPANVLPAVGPVASPRAIRGARPIPHASPAASTRSATTTATAARPTAPPVVAPTPLSAPTAPLANFDGTSSRDSAVTNFGAEFEPPDQGLCVGNGFVVDMVNSAYTIFNESGKALSGPFNVNVPFGEGLREFTSDPRCYYDKATNTWFAVILFINDAFDRSRIDLAVNTSGDPTTPWTNYKFDTSDIGGATGPRHAGCPCLGDQPLLGIDPYNVYVSTNEFSLAGPEFNGAQIYAIAKGDLVAHRAAAHFVHYDNLNIGGGVAASVQPAITNGSPGVEYFMNALDPEGTFDNRIGVWALANPGAVATGGKPRLSSRVLASEAYGIPPAAAQKESTVPLETGDDRMQQVQYINGALWGTLDTAVSVPNDPTDHAGAAWFKVVPSFGGGVVSGATMAAQGYVALFNANVLFPALQVRPTGRGAMVFTVAGTSRYPSAAYSVIAPGASAFGPVSIAATGAGRYDPDAGRWGDYSAAVLDPNGTSVWLATEYIPPPSRQTQDRRRNWGTRVLRVAGG